MTTRTLWEEYLICQERGHTPSNVTTASNPPQSICAKCGTYYWYSLPQLIEGMNKPTPPEAKEEAVLDGTYGDHCGDVKVHDQHNWRNDAGSWYCMGTYIRKERKEPEA